MKKLIWTDEEQVDIGGVGLVSKGSIFDIDNIRAESFIEQKKAKAHGDTVKPSSVKKSKDIEGSK